MKMQDGRAGAQFVSRLQSSSQAAQQAAWLQTRRAWGNWLGQVNWSHFCTLTFRYPHGQEAALAKFRHWIRQVEQRAQQPLGWFQVLERGAAAGLWHLHVLLWGTTHVPNEGLMEAWSYGRAHASMYDSRRGASYYVTKEVGTDVVDYDIEFRHLPSLSS